MSTTIQITDSQRKELESLKQVSDESLKSVLQRLIDGYDNEQIAVSKAEAREIAREVVRDEVTHRALE